MVLKSGDQKDLAVVFEHNLGFSLKEEFHLCQRLDKFRLCELCPKYNKREEYILGFLKFLEFFANFRHWKTRQVFLALSHPEAYSKQYLLYVALNFGDREFSDNEKKLLFECLDKGIIEIIVQGKDIFKDYDIRIVKTGEMLDV